MMDLPRFTTTTAFRSTARDQQPQQRPSAPTGAALPPTHAIPSTPPYPASERLHDRRMAPYQARYLREPTQVGGSRTPIANPDESTLLRSLDEAMQRHEQARASAGAYLSDILARLSAAVTKGILDLRLCAHACPRRGVPDEDASALRALADTLDIDIPTVVLEKLQRELPASLANADIKHLVVPHYAGSTMDLRPLSPPGMSPRVLLLNPSRLQCIYAHPGTVIDIVGGGGQTRILMPPPLPFVPTGQSGRAGDNTPASVPSTAGFLTRLRGQDPDAARLLSSWLACNAQYTYVTTFAGWSMAIVDLFLDMQQTGATSLAVQMLGGSAEMALELTVGVDGEGIPRWRVDWRDNQQRAGMLGHNAIEQWQRTSLAMLLGRQVFTDNFGTGDGLWRLNIWPDDIAGVATQVPPAAFMTAVQTVNREISLLPPQDIVRHPELFHTLVRANLTEAVDTIWETWDLSDERWGNLLLESEHGVPSSLECALQSPQPDMLMRLIEIVDTLALPERVKMEILWAGRDLGPRRVSGFEQACGNKNVEVARAYLAGVQASALDDQSKEALMLGTLEPGSRPVLEHLLLAGDVDGVINAALAILTAHLPRARQHALLGSAEGALQTIETMHVATTPASLDELEAALVLSQRLPRDVRPASAPHRATGNAHMKGPATAPDDADHRTIVARRRAAQVLRMIVAAHNAPAQGERSLFQ